MENEEPESDDDDQSSSDSRDDYYDSIDEEEHSYERMEKKLFGKYGSTGDKKRGDNGPGDKSGKKTKIYCAICAGRHVEEKCPNKMYSKSHQLNSVRQRFADAQKATYMPEDYHYDKQHNRHNSGRRDRSNHRRNDSGGQSRHNQQNH